MEKKKDWEVLLSGKERYLGRVVSKDERRPFLHGVHITSDYAEATDCHIMCRADCQ